MTRVPTNKRSKLALGTYNFMMMYFAVGFTCIVIFSYTIVRRPIQTYDIRFRYSFKLYKGNSPNNFIGLPFTIVVANFVLVCCMGIDLCGKQKISN